MPANLIQRFTKRTLYTAEDVEAMIAAILAGTLDQALVERTIESMQEEAGRPGDAGRISRAFARMRKQDRVLDRAIFSRWRTFLAADRFKERWGLK